MAARWKIRSGRAGDECLGGAGLGEIDGERLHGAGKLRRIGCNDVGQGQPLDAAASHLPLLDQRTDKLAADHAGRADHEDMHRSYPSRRFTAAHPLRVSSEAS